ncbi:MAG: phosphoglyceromutase, partial [Acidobacteria bacterium]|nr:phosphoglyceromutase [Acidobacteriota bacterium]
MRLKILLTMIVLALGADAYAQSANDARVVLVMTDGMRWQEIFRGADESLLTKDRYYKGRSVDELRKKYLAGTAEERRQALMPFLWSTFIPQGQIYGDRDAGSEASVTNGFNFSYPGYSETLTGHGDPRIDSNDDKPNPNLTVLAWLSKQPGFQGKVAAF